MSTSERMKPAPGRAYVPYEEWRLGDYEGRVSEMDEFFAGRGEVRRTMNEFARRLDEAGIPYLVIGGMALNAHDFIRVTTDLDVVLTGEDRRRVHDLLDGLGFVPPFTGSRNLRDTTNGVKIDLILAGEPVGTSEPKPIVFPDPHAAPVFVRDGVRFVTLESLVELKLASGMSNELRYKDLGDVVSLLGVLGLPREFGDRLHPWVREKWFDIWDKWQAEPRKDY